MWQHIPRRQLILQRQSYSKFYKDKDKDKGRQSLGSASQTAASELLDLQNKIEQGFTTLSNVDRRLGSLVQTGEKLSDIKSSWQKLQVNQNYAEFRDYDVLLDQLDNFRLNIVDASNLILDQI